ncbi:hypothetical protein [Sphingorhabdus sp.]|uniref:hypothetical protein n=1 Tax=Sphingorhabdus sp. TaxID=1902408 RepID=UPI003593BC73
MPVTFHQDNLVALLSAADATAEQSSTHNTVEPIRVAGNCLLEIQLMALRRAGCSFFIIEVDNVSGALLAMVDRFRREGLSLEFARNINDLRELVRPGMRLIIQAEDHFYSDELIADLMAHKTAFLAAIDSREENADFERIDLNTRWAGFAAMNAEVIFKMKELPDDWNLVSSLLRQAVQEKLEFLMVPQVHLQNRAIAKINSKAKAHELNNLILNFRSKVSSGWVERTFYAPFAKLLALRIWSNDNFLSLSSFSGIILSLVCLALAFFDLPILALFGALGCLFCNYLDFVVQGNDFDLKNRTWPDRIFWLILCTSGLVVSYSLSYYSSDTISFMAVVIGLAILARSLTLPHWVKALLLSPSLIVICLILAALMSVFSIGIKAVVLAQLLLLIAGRHLSERKHVKND